MTRRSARSPSARWRPGIPVEVVSDGFGFFIEPALDALGVGQLPVVTAATTFGPDGARIEFPNGNPDCFVCGTCKRNRVLAHQAAGRAVAFIGDGPSDRYAAGYSDVVFAKESLEQICIAEGWAYRRWTDFREIHAWLDADARGLRGRPVVPRRPASPPALLRRGGLGSRPLRPRPGRLRARFPRNESTCLGAIPCRPGHRGRARTRGPMDRRQLVERAGRGDHDAFTALATAASTRLDAAARLILRDRELARDAVQNALVRAWRDLPGLRDPDRFDAWLHRLLVNACLDEARRRRRRPIEVEIQPIDEPTIRDDAGQLADRDLVERALSRLEPEQRALVVMHYYLGYPLPEAASSLGISVPAAKSRLHRAMTGLRRVLAADSIDGVGLEGGRTA